MKCPMCGTNTQFNFLYCPNCGYKIALEVEQPIPNWRQLPGFRSKTPWKMILAVMIYVWILLAIVASFFGGII
ncbi:hypothetical protein [Pelosinus fermentans]|jgi:uncharacterized membrane protein YvbJ|uniref:Zinc-ribbon domain-containing protein n=1 Tax=Pelosinus fermentans JBW45 TaxID=1192197 RepID=I8TTJ8_9FIRM|nr:hypothetical protein [Pelosinus fermentans]AJQ28216.1 hypothetical protein JBW_02873 [Pelosinus fermentans JBW45]